MRQLETVQFGPGQVDIPESSRVSRGQDSVSSTLDGLPETKENLRSKAPQYFFVPDGTGRQIKYCFGKETVAGQSMPIRPLVMSVKRLDPYTAAIVQHNRGKDQPEQQVLYTIDLLTEDELEQRQGETVEVAEEEVAKRTKEYSGQAILAQRADENLDDYLERIKKINGVRSYMGLVREVVDEWNIDIRNWPWQDQIIVAGVLLDLDREQLKVFAEQFGEDGLRALTALDYSPEMKDVIFELAEKSPEQAKLIFKAFGGLKNQAWNLARSLDHSEIKAAVPLSQESANGFTFQIQEAVTRRAKDMLCTARAVAVQGQAEALVFGQKRIICESLEEVSKALQIYAEALEKVDSLARPAAGLARYRFNLQNFDNAQTPEIYNFEVMDKKTNKPSYFALHMRQRGVSFGQHNSQGEFNGEARMNFLFSDQPISQSISEPSRQQALSIRLDRESMERENGKIILDHPEAQDGQLAIDIGALSDNQDRSDGAVLSRVAAIGNALAAEGQNKKYPEYYHNRESFMRELGDADVFAAMVKFVRQKVVQYYAKDSSIEESV